MWQAAKSVCMSRLASRGDVYRGIRLDIDQYRSFDLCEFLAETLEFAEIPYGVCPNAEGPRDVRELRPVTEGVLRIDAVCGQGVVLHAVARVIQDHHHEPQFEPDCRPEFDQPHHAAAVTDHRNRGPIRAPIAAPIDVGIPRPMDPKFAACMTDCDCLTHR